MAEQKETTFYTEEKDCYIRSSAVEFFKGKQKEKESVKCIIMPCISENKIYKYDSSLKAVQKDLYLKRFDKGDFKKSKHSKRCKKKMKRTFYMTNIQSIKAIKVKTKCFGIKTRKQCMINIFKKMHAKNESYNLSYLKKIKNINIKSSDLSLIYQFKYPSYLLYTRNATNIYEQVENLNKKKLENKKSKNVKNKFVFFKKFLKLKKNESSV